MVSQMVTIINPTGLHLRPAGLLCKEAMKFKSLITFRFRGNTANAIELICEGEDEELALKTLVHAIESGLGE